MEEIMILCVGETVIDMILKNNAGSQEAYTPLPGGSLYNTSIAIGRLGVPVAFMGRLSKNIFTEPHIKRLRENNVRDDLLIRSIENPVLAIVKTEEEKGSQYVFYNEGTADSLLSVEDIPPLSLETKCIAFGSISMNMEPAATTIETLILREAKRKIVISFDPNIRPFMIKDRNEYMKRLEKWVSACTITKSSSEDFEYIFPKIEPQEALEKMLKLGARLSVATTGAGGAIALLKRSNGNVIKVCTPGIHIPQIADTVGAGDTFHGAFLSWLELHDKLSQNAILDMSRTDLNDALTFANKAAAIVCTRNGAEPPYLDELRSALSN